MLCTIYTHRTPYWNLACCSQVIMADTNQWYNICSYTECVYMFTAYTLCSIITYIQVMHEKQSLSKSHATHYSCKTTHNGDWHVHTHHPRMQGKGTVTVVQGSFGVMKLHFRVLDSEPLIVRSLYGVLLWVLPVKNCIGLEQQVNDINTQDFEYAPSDSPAVNIHDVLSDACVDIVSVCVRVCVCMCVCVCVCVWCHMHTYGHYSLFLLIIFYGVCFTWQLPLVITERSTNRPQTWLLTCHVYK